MNIYNGTELIGTIEPGMMNKSTGSFIVKVTTPEKITIVGTFEHCVEELERKFSGIVITTADYGVWQFFIAWKAGTDGEDTDVFTVNDLIPQYEKGNVHVCSFEIFARTETDARLIGLGMAFGENFTFENTVHTIRRLQS